MLIKAVFIWSKSIFAINRQTTIFVAASPRGKKKKKSQTVTALDTTTVYCLCIYTHVNKSAFSTEISLMR